MKNQRQTIRKIVSFLNNPEDDGGFWLPNIQRPFVWREDQICRLFDSILREYPISTLLVWKTTSGIRRRKFIDNWKGTLHLSDFYGNWLPRRYERQPSKRGARRGRRRLEPGVHRIAQVPINGACARRAATRTPPGRRRRSTRA